MTNSSGVYLITCNVTGKRYVGCSRNIKRRWRWHQYNLKINQHHNEHLQRSYNKHGPKAFVYTVLELTDQENIFKLENYYIESLKPEYNMLKNPYTSPDRWKYNEALEPYEDYEIDWRMFENRIWMTEDEIIKTIDNSKKLVDVDPHMLWFESLDKDEQIILHLNTMTNLGLLSLDKLRKTCKDIGYDYNAYRAKLKTILERYPIELTGIRL